MSELKKGRIYYVDLGEGKGSEISKVRPCLVIQNDIGNKYSPTTIVAPITSMHKRIKLLPTHVELKPGMFTNYNNTMEGIILLEQIRTIDTTRIVSGFCLGILTAQAMKSVKTATFISLAL